MATLPELTGRNRQLLPTESFLQAKLFGLRVYTHCPLHSPDILRGKYEPSDLSGEIKMSKEG